MLVKKGDSDRCEARAMGEKTALLHEFTTSDIDVLEKKISIPKIQNQTKFPH